MAYLKYHASGQSCLDESGTETLWIFTGLRHTHLSLVIPKPVAEHNNGKPIKTSKPIDRNQPCHCGSGKKYKKCHGKR